MKKNVFVFIGIPRSGNHAVLNWIIKNNSYLGDIRFVNAISPKSVIFENKEELYKNEHMVLVSIETVDPLGFKSFFNLSKRLGHLGIDNLQGLFERRKNLLLLRDPFNFCAIIVERRDLYEFET